MVPTNEALLLLSSGKVCFSWLWRSMPQVAPKLGALLQTKSVTFLTHAGSFTAVLIKQTTAHLSEKTHLTGVHGEFFGTVASQLIGQYFRHATARPAHHIARRCSRAQSIYPKQPTPASFSSLMVGAYSLDGNSKQNQTSHVATGISRQQVDKNTLSWTHASGMLQSDRQFCI